MHNILLGGMLFVKLRRIRMGQIWLQDSLRFHSPTQHWGIWAAPEEEVLLIRAQAHLDQ